MQSYTRYFENTNHYYSEQVYILFCEYVKKIEYGERLYEFGIPAILKDKIEFIKTLAKEISVSIVDLFKMFMDKYVFKLFSLIGWSFQELFKKLKQGYELYKDFMKAITEFIEQTGVVKWTQEKLIELDEFLKKHPKTRRIAGVALGALLLYMWLSMTFVGNPGYDFDISMIIDSLLGKVSLAQVFGGASGLAFISLFATGLFFKLSFPWPGTNLVKLAFAVIMTLGKKLHMKLKVQSKGKIEREIAEV